MNSAGLDRFSASFHRTQRDRDSLSSNALVPITLPAMDIARGALKAVAKAKAELAALGDEVVFDGDPLGQIETYALAVLYAKRRTEVSAPAELPETYRQAVLFRDRLSIELDPLMRSGLLDWSIVADVTSDRGYAVVAQELLRLAARAINEHAVVTAHTTLGLDELEDAFRTAQLLNSLRQRYERLDQSLLAARLDLQRALTLLVHAYDAARDVLTSIEEATAVEAAPPSTQPTPEAGFVEEDEPVDTERTPPPVVILMPTKMKKCA